MEIFHKNCLLSVDIFSGKQKNAWKNEIFQLAILLRCLMGVVVQFPHVPLLYEPVFPVGLHLPWCTSASDSLGAAACPHDEGRTWCSIGDVVWPGHPPYRKAWEHKVRALQCSCDPTTAFPNWIISVSAKMFQVFCFFFCHKVELFSRKLTSPPLFVKMQVSTERHK